MRLAAVSGRARALAGAALPLLWLATGAAAAAAEAGPLFALSGGPGHGRVDYERLGTAFASQRGGGPAVGLFAGRAFDAEFAVGVRAVAWGRAFANADGDDETWTCALVALALAWRPGRGGFFLRAGPGWGRAEVELDYGDVKVAGAESGPAALAAAGWTWRVARGLEVGPVVEAGVARLEGAWRADFASIVLEASWRP